MSNRRDSLVAEVVGDRNLGRILARKARRAKAREDEAKAKVAEATNQMLTATTVESMVTMRVTAGPRRR
jgi:hypothetical protein